MSFLTAKTLYQVLGFVFLLCKISQAAEEESIGIPVSISPIVQLPFIETSVATRYFYSQDKDFYSKVTVLDVARNEEKHLTETIKKPISVVFLIAASSYVSRTLTQSELAFPAGRSKWCYKVPVKKILDEANGSLTKLTDQMDIYKLQELAIKVLERRYGFNKDSILQKLRMDVMDFYAADEEQWIQIVGAITDIIIEKRSYELNLPRCYLAELINKTQEQMGAFTLYEVDAYLNNATKLREELPAYENATLNSFYRAFNMTPPQLAELSNTKTEVVNSMGVQDTIQLFTRTILLKYNFTKMMLPSTNPENETLCCPEWNFFRDELLTEAFEKQAREMSITPTTLGALIHLPYRDVKKFTLINMLHYIETFVIPLKEDKRKIEKLPFSMLRNLTISKKLNTKKHNAISLIKRATKLSKRKLKLLYGWTSHDYHFARLFSVSDLGEECSFDVEKKTLLTLANINIGEANEEINCTAFVALRLVWGQASLSDLRQIYHPNTRASLDEPIVVTVSKLTNSSLRRSYRVLSNAPIIQWLLQKTSLNNLTEMTNYTDIYLQEIPIQRLMLLMHELYNAGSFDVLIKVFKTINYSTNESREYFTEEIYFGVKQVGYGQPTAQPRSMSKHHLPDIVLLVAFLIAASSIT